MIEIDYDETPAVFDEMEAIQPTSPLVHASHATSDSDSAYFDMRPQDGTNVCHRFRIRTAALQGRDEPDLVIDPPRLEDDPFADAFADADVIVEDTFHVPAAAHVPMEPHATTAQWVDGRLEVTTGTQTPFNLRQDLAGVFGLATEDVRVIAPPMGGAFGSKTFVRTEAITALAARRVDRPVRCVLDRDEVFNELTRHAATVRMRIGATRDRPLRGQADVVLRQHRRLRRLRSRRRPEDGVRRRRSLPLRPRGRGLLLHLHQPPAGRRLPRATEPCSPCGPRNDSSTSSPTPSAWTPWSSAG